MLAHRDAHPLNSEPVIVRFLLVNWILDWLAHFGGWNQWTVGIGQGGRDLMKHMKCGPVHRHPMANAANCPSPYCVQGKAPVTTQDLTCRLITSTISWTRVFEPKDQTYIEH